MTWNTPKPGEWKSEELSQGRIIDYKAFNFVDGEGVRNSLYVAGCMFHCEGCYNVATWSFNAGIPLYQRVGRTDHGRSGPTLCSRFDPTRWRAIPEYWNSFCLSLNAFGKSCPTKTSGLGPATPGKK